MPYRDVFMSSDVLEPVRAARALERTTPRINRAGAAPDYWWLRAKESNTWQQPEQVPTPQRKSEP